MQRTAQELLRLKVAGLLKQHGWSQVQFAERLRELGIRRSQAWVSRKVTGVQAFGTRDLDLLVAAFDITLPELFFDEYGQWDRRSGSDRRKSERRQARRTIYDPRLEITPETSRLGFPAKATDDV